MMKKLAKTEKGVVRVIQEQNKRFKDTYSVFYPNDMVANFDFPAIDNEALDFLYDWSEIFTDKDQEGSRQTTLFIVICAMMFETIEILFA